MTRTAIKLMALTFVRTSELIGARWDEFDLDAARWDIPETRMKMKTPHVVPLSKQAVELLRALHTLTGHGALLFPGERDHAKPMSNNTILKALERMGYLLETFGLSLRWGRGGWVTCCPLCGFESLQVSRERLRCDDCGIGPMSVPRFHAHVTECTLQEAAFLLGCWAAGAPMPERSRRLHSRAAFAALPFIRSAAP